MHNANDLYSIEKKRKEDMLSASDFVIAIIVEIIKIIKIIKITAAHRIWYLQHEHPTYSKYDVKNKKNAQLMQPE